MHDKLLFYSHRQIKGISEVSEKSNWEKGILSLEQLAIEEGRQINLFDENLVNPFLSSLKRNDIALFKETLEKHDYYRIAFSYPEKVVFLDIETTGLSKVYSYITVIGWYIDGIYKHTLYGNSLNELVEDLKKAEILITFNGSLFDLPFLKSHYSELIDVIESLGHIDLRFFLKKYGHTGGQKEIEDKMGYRRPKSLTGTDGKEAISLWYKFLKGDDKSLSKLLYYNCYDIFGMVYLFNHVFFNQIYGIEFPKVGKPQKFLRKHKAKFLNFSKMEVENARNSVEKNITFFKHSFLINSYKYRVVGIDLTGSESKASGCAIIEGNLVETMLLFSDEDIMDYILTNKIDLVSIDSPLSMPYGRSTVFDDDPRRDEIGIMRYCERELKKRGVNVYPSLIPSMQKLTKRGIELAQKIRKMGVPVIESFPGAAQDVLQIPRKKTDLFFLKQGLIDFGIEGDFEFKQISHDELDAITSALVGQFFISGYYEALGNVDEDYLIIPSIKKCIDKKKKIIGVCGPIATGKTELARYIEKKGYAYIRYSMIISDYLKENNIEDTRENLQKYGYIIFSEYGQYWLNRRLVSKIEGDEFVVIDGLRHPEDVTFLKEHFFDKFLSIYIDSKLDDRKKRFEKLTSDDYTKTMSHSVEQNIEKLKDIVDFHIKNEGTRESLFLELESIVDI